MKSDSTPPGGSRRVENHRAPIGIEVIFQAHDEPPRLGTLEDLSSGGARIEASKPCREGEGLLVHLPWPSADEPTTVTAVVRWVEGSRMGVQFSIARSSEGEAIRLLRASSRAHGDKSEKNDKGEKSGALRDESAFSRDALLAVREPIHRMPRRVRFQEVDAAGTIYYSRVFEYFGDAYIDLLDRGGVSVPKVMAKQLWAAPLVHAEAEYLAPMRFGDHVVVEVATAACGTSSATVGYRITTEDGRVLGVGHTVHVFVDATTFRPCPIPADVRQALLPAK